MHDIRAIIKKELDRFFRDKRLLLTIIILPGLLIFVMYSLMGTAFSSLSSSEESTYSIAYVNETPDGFVSKLDATEVDYTLQNIPLENLGICKEKILNSEIDYLIVFPENFDSLIGTTTIPNIDTFYNPGNSNSTQIDSIINSIFNEMHQEYIADKFGDITQFSININNKNNAIFDENEVFGQVYAMMLPFLILIFLFTGAMGITPESIAGDKERGTMAMLLVTPTRRSNIALGKIIALSIIAVLSAFSSFVGIISSLPKLLSSSGSELGNIGYGFSDYLALLLVLVSTVLLIVGMLSIVSAYAKNIKESSSLVIPLYLVVMLIGILGLFSQNAAQEWYFYLIPVYNSLQCMIAVFTFDVSVLNIFLCVVSNAVYTVLLIYLLAKMFNSEKIMFSK